jgi:hypothetical protein
VGAWPPVSYCEYEYRNEDLTLDWAEPELEEEWSKVECQEGRAKDGWEDAERKGVRTTTAGCGNGDSVHDDDDDDDGGDGFGGGDNEEVALFLDNSMMTRSWGNPRNGTKKKGSMREKLGQQHNHPEVVEGKRQGWEQMQQTSRSAPEEGWGRDSGAHASNARFTGTACGDRLPETLEAKLSRRFVEMRASQVAQAESAVVLASKIKVRLRGGYPVSGLASSVRSTRAGGCPLGRSITTPPTTPTPTTTTTTITGITGSATRDISFGIDLSLRKYKFNSPPGGGERLQKQSELRSAESKAEKKMRLAAEDATRRRMRMEYG